jgi:hypothetical protein
LPKTPKEKAEAPIFTVDGLHRVIPLGDGEVLLVEANETKLIHEDTGQSKRYPRKFKQHFQKQRE